MEKQHEASIGYLRKEKVSQQLKYEKQIALLTIQKESWRKGFCQSQRTIALQRKKIAVLEVKLKAAAVKAKRSRRFADKMGAALADCLTVQAAQEKSCKEKIQYLEQIAANRDNGFVISKQVFRSKKNLRKEKVLKIKLLTNRLHTVFQLQKYKIKQKISVKRYTIGIAAPLVK